MMTCHICGRATNVDERGPICECAEELKQARDHTASCLELVSSIRFALGDYGERMQPELIEYCMELAALPARVAELEAAALCGCGDQFNADFPGICPSCLVVKEIERDDLAMLTRLLIRKVRKTSPDDETARKALDFLTRHNLQGSPLR